MSVEAKVAAALTLRPGRSTMALALRHPFMTRLLSHRKVLRTAVCLLVLLCAGAVAYGQKLDQLKPQGYVNDFAGVLSAAGKAQLTALCSEVDQKAHAQIAVVTVKSLEGQSVEDYAINLATKWGVGPKQLDRGILILLAVDDRKYWTTVGYGLEPILPDGKVGGFGREAVPLLRNNDYDGALLLITRRIADVVAADRGVTLTGASPAPVRTAPQQKSGWSVGEILLLLFFIYVVYSIISRSGTGGGSGRGRSGSGWWIGPMIGGSMGGGRGGWGGGGFGGGGGGGGFGGFGGGSFGGGGAGGSW
jgi:uncharacterized protein